jgi:hypothetical protein
VVLFTAIAVIIALRPGMLPDFFIFRIGSVLALRGENPYDIEKVRLHVKEQFPDNEGFINNCGYFLPPHAIVLFLPLAILPLPVASVAWALLHGAAAIAIVLLLRLLSREGDPPLSGLVPKLVPFLLLFNFLTLAIVMKGQASVVSAGCVAAGLWCFARETRWSFWLGVFLWSVPFIKPHVALPLIPLAWYLGGWKRAAALVGVVAVLNLLGATLVGGSPMFMRDYFDYLAASHRSVEFNRAELNYEMPSWNRLLYVATRPFAENRFLIEQNARITLASYFMWFGLVLGRCAISGVKPSASWALAVCAVAAVWCPQVLGYEVFMLVLAVPWVRDLFLTGRRPWGLAAVVLLALQAVSFQLLEPLGFDFHRPLGVALFALLVLIGPTGSFANLGKSERSAAV